jgi:hypothetical protein
MTPNRSRYDSAGGQEPENQEGGRSGALHRWYSWLKKPSLIWLRIPLGILLVLAGLVGFLPILGFWMIPLGLSLLAVDFPPAHRLMRWLTAKGEHLWRKWVQR